MKPVLLTASLMVPLICIGCSSFEDDMQMVCQAPKAIDATNLDADARATAVANHIANNLKTAEGKQLFADLGGSLSPEERRARLEAAVKKAGIDDCPFLALSEPSSAASGASP